jgi:hypothetical protein
MVSFQFKWYNFYKELCRNRLEKKIMMYKLIVKGTTIVL